MIFLIYGPKIGSISTLQDVDQRDVTFEAIIPDEVLQKGWKSVLAYLRELRLQGSEPLREVRVFLLGEGAQGKTSFRRALANPSGRTQPIDLDDRTVGIDIAVGIRQTELLFVLLCGFYL
jgi:hypothetical protein